MTDEKTYSSELFKKWYKTSKASGFLSITPWFEDGSTHKPVMKLSIEIGRMSQAGSVESATKCYVDALHFAAYLDAVRHGTADVYVIKMGDSWMKEAVEYYGGTQGSGSPVSRIFKCHYWDNGDDTRAFAWKCGHFNANTTSSGAITPNFNSPLSTDMIRVTRPEMHEIALRVQLALHSYASTRLDWYDVG